MKIKNPNHKNLKWLLPERELRDNAIDILLMMNFREYLTDLDEKYCHVLEFLTALNPADYRALAITTRFYQIASYWIDTKSKVFLRWRDSSYYRLFRLATENGHLGVLHFLADKAPKHLEAMIKTDNYRAFYGATTHGRLDVACFLVQCGCDVKTNNNDVPLLNRCLGILKNDKETASQQLPAMQSGLFLVCHGARYQNLEYPGNNLLERLFNTLKTLDEKTSKQCLDYIKHGVNQIPMLRDDDIKKRLPHSVKQTTLMLFGFQKKSQEMERHLPKPLLERIALASQPQHVLAENGFDRFRLLNKEAIAKLIEEVVQLYANTESLTKAY